MSASQNFKKSMKFQKNDDLLNNNRENDSKDRTAKLSYYQRLIKKPCSRGYWSRFQTRRQNGGNTAKRTSSLATSLMVSCKISTKKQKKQAEFFRRKRNGRVVLSGIAKINQWQRARRLGARRGLHRRGVGALHVASQLGNASLDAGDTGFDCCQTSVNTKHHG